MSPPYPPVPGVDTLVPPIALGIGVLAGVLVYSHSIRHQIQAPLLWSGFVGVTFFLAPIILTSFLIPIYYSLFIPSGPGLLVRPLHAILRETLSHPPLTIYTPKEEDMNQMGIQPRDEPGEISRESTAGLWLHMAAEVSKASATLLVSPVIISATNMDTYDHHFHTDSFDQEDAKEILHIINT